MKPKPQSDPHNSHVPGVPDTVGVGTAGGFPGSSGAPLLPNLSKRSARPSIVRLQDLSMAELRQFERELERFLKLTAGAFPGLAEVWSPNEGEQQAGMLIEEASKELQLVKSELIKREMAQEKSLQSDDGQVLSSGEGSDEGFMTVGQQPPTAHTSTSETKRTESATLDGNSNQKDASAENKTEPMSKGRPRTRSASFCAGAAGLWAEAMKQATGKKVSCDQLKQIASELDRLNFVPPAEYLERTIAAGIRGFNSMHSNSKGGPIKTWGKLVEYGDKDHLRGMRKLLSRCA